MRNQYKLLMLVTLTHCIFGANLLAKPNLSLKDFQQVGNAQWNLHNNVISSESGKGFLVTKNTYQNFHIKLEFYSGNQTNSGVFMRCYDINKITDQTCYESNIFDHRPEQSGRTGSIVNLSAPKEIIQTENQWNTYEIKMDGKRLTVKLNGITTVDTTDNKHSSGYIALQYAGGNIKFRNIQITDLNSHKEMIKGIWKLNRFDLIDESGDSQPWCEGSFGSIMYTDTYMSVSINCKTDARKIVFYSGPYKTEKQSVFHQVRNMHDIDKIQTFKRQVQFRGNDQLDLIGPFGESGKVIVSWKRL